MEINHDITIEEIFIPAKHSKDTYLCEDFIIYPEGKEKNGGYLMGILELRATPVAESEKIIQAVINNLKEHYYNQINASPDPQKLNLETVFEYALQKTNAAIVEMIQIGHVNLVLENLNYIIAAAKPNLQTKDIDFIFAQQGLINAYILHKTKQNNYKVINIVDNTPRIKEDPAEKLKIFSSILSGKIYHHNALFLCSEIFGNYIPAHKVNKILSVNDLSTGIDYFKNLINNVKNNSHLTYCAIFIKMEERRNLSDQPISQRSINNLLSTAERTEKYLTPTFALNFRDYFRKFFALFRPNKDGRKQLHSPAEQKKLKFGLIKYFFNIIKTLVFLLGRGLKNLWLIFSGQKKISLFSLKKTLALPSTVITRSKDKLASLHRLNKTILIIIILLIALLVSGVFWVKHRNEVKKEQAAYSIQIQSIKDLLNNSQVNLIYNNKDKSLELLKQAEEIIKYLPQATTAQKANFTELTKQSNGLRDRLLNITKVVPQLIAEITRNNAPVNLLGLKKLNDKLVAFGQDPSLYTIDPAGKTVVAGNPSEQGDLSLGLEEDSKLLFITNQNKLLSYNPETKSFIQKSIVWPAGANVESAELYNGNIYALSAGNEQIYRYKSARDDFGAGQPWIKNKKDADLKSAVGLAIDGNVYLLTAAGQSYKFFTGEIKDFSVKAIEPPITQAKKIFTAADLPYLYILETNSKRIVAINKDGSFANQYSFDTLDAPITDFIINGSTISLVSGNRVYQAALQ